MAQFFAKSEFGLEKLAQINFNTDSSILASSSEHSSFIQLKGSSYNITYPSMRLFIKKLQWQFRQLNLDNNFRNKSSVNVKIWNPTLNGEVVIRNQLRASKYDFFVV